MAFFLSPVLNTQQLDANGIPLAGGLINTYLAGTTTPALAYKTAAGVAWTNPIVLDSSGYYPSGSQLYLQSGQAYKLVITDSTGANARTYDNIIGIGDTSAGQDEWILYGGLPTYVNATSFTIIGDQTNIFQRARRIKSLNTGGTVYSTIQLSAFAAGVTTVTVTNTSGVLDNGLSQVSYAVLSATNPSVPDLYAGLSPSLNIPVHQSVISGALARSSIGTGLAVNLIATATPIQIAFPAGSGNSGFMGYMASLSADSANFWGALTPSTTNYLFYNRNVTSGAITAIVSTLPYIAQDSSAAISVVNGQHTFVYDLNAMYVGNGTTSTVVQRVAEGEAVTNATNVTSVVSYAKQGKYISPGATVQGVGTVVTASHNIGAMSNLQLYLRNVTAAGNYVPGDMVPFSGVYNNGTFAGNGFIGRLIASVNTNGTLALVDKLTGSVFAITNGNWQWVFVCNRAF